MNKTRHKLIERTVHLPPRLAAILELEGGDDRADEFVIDALIDYLNIPMILVVTTDWLKRNSGHVTSESRALVDVRSKNLSDALSHFNRVTKTDHVFVAVHRKSVSAISEYDKMYSQYSDIDTATALLHSLIEAVSE